LASSWRSIFKEKRTVRVLANVPLSDILRFATHFVPVGKRASSEILIDYLTGEEMGVVLLLLVASGLEVAPWKLSGHCACARGLLERAIPRAGLWRGKGVFFDN
jgi:hypothetical protein